MWAGAVRDVLRVRVRSVRGGSGQNFSNTCRGGAGLKFAGAGRERTKNSTRAGY